MPSGVANSGQTAKIWDDPYGYRHVYTNQQQYHAKVAVGKPVALDAVAGANLSDVVLASSALNLYFNGSYSVEIGVVAGHTSIGTFDEPVGFIAVWNLSALKPMQVMFLSEPPEYVELNVEDDGSIYAVRDWDLKRVYVAKTAKHSDYLFIYSGLEEVYRLGD